MSAPHHSVSLQAKCPSCHPTNSIKALKVLIYTDKHDGKENLNYKQHAGLRSDHVHITVHNRGAQYPLCVSNDKQYHPTTNDNLYSRRPISTIFGTNVSKYDIK